MEKDKFLEAALYYRRVLKWSVVPVAKGKKDRPLVKWAEFQKRLPDISEIISWWTEWPESNIAVITGKISNLMVVDHDSYKPEYNTEETLKLIPDSFVTPTAISPRGGSHQYCICPKDSITIRAGLVPGLDYRCEGGFIIAPPSVNGDGKAYEWSIRPEESPLGEIPQAILQLINKTSNIRINKNNIYIHGGDEKNSVNQLQSASLDSFGFKSGTRDQDLFHIAHLLVKAKCEPEYLEKTLKILALNCEPPFPLAEAEIKIKSAIERAAKKERNLMDEVREWVGLQDGFITASNGVKWLQVASRDEQRLFTQCLRRLCKEGVIEKIEGKVGFYRVFDTSEELIDYKSADVAPYDIKMPFRIHEFVTVHKGVLIVVAGESNAGKSAFCLNVAEMNKDKFKVNYLSSEMQNGAELRIRLDKFNIPIESWDPVKFQFRTDNFPDKIDPDGLNIVDYLDEGNDQEAYKMPMRLRLIADKLKGGIAVVAIQKAPGKDLGFGGSGTLNRARLYITLKQRPNTITIEKGKIWRQQDTNPNGMNTEFKLIGGSSFIQIGDWRFRT